MIRHTDQEAAYEAAWVTVVPDASSKEVRQTAAHFLSTSGVRRFDVDVIPRKIRDDTKTVHVKISVRVEDNSSIGLLFSEDAVLKGECILNRETL